MKVGALKFSHKIYFHPCNRKRNEISFGEFWTPSNGGAWHNSSISSLAQCYKSSKIVVILWVIIFIPTTFVPCIDISKQNIDLLYIFRLFELGNTTEVPSKQPACSSVWSLCCYLHHSQHCWNRLRGRRVGHCWNNLILSLKNTFGHFLPDHFCRSCRATYTCQLAPTKSVKT